jgi:two-component system, NarL family, sensor kinase
VSVPQPLMTEHVNRAADLRRLLRLLLVIFMVAVLITEPPAERLALCWVVVGCYLVWTLTIYALGTGDRTRRFLWLALFVDVAVLASLTLITEGTAAVSWTPYLIINGFFLIPVIAAAQLSPAICAAVVIPTVVVYLVSGLLTRHAEQEPLSYTVLRTAMLATVGLGAILLSRLQRSRVQTIAGLLADRTTLLSQMITIEQREQRNLAEALHDGALQYVLGARQELDDLADGDPDAARRIDVALTESARLLRTSMSQLHPAVIEATGLLPALRDLVEATRARGRFALTLTSDGWSESDRTGADELLLTTARELLVNVVKHADARTVLVELSREAGWARLRVTDDGRGMGDVDLSDRLAEGHLGLTSRRIRIEAVGGTLSLSPAEPRGTVAGVLIPLTPTASAGGAG